MRCAYCGFENLERHQFCGKCGKPLAMQSIQSANNQIDLQALVKRITDATGFSNAQLATVVALAILVVMVFIGLFGAIVVAMNPNANGVGVQPGVALPTPTLAVLNMTIDNIEHCCSNMTQIQEKEYLLTLVGKRVNWQGTIDNVQTDGTIWVRVSSTRIEMNGAPSDVAAKLSKGQKIDFYAIITKAENSFLLPGVQLRFESLK